MSFRRGNKPRGSYPKGLTTGIEKPLPKQAKVVLMKIHFPLTGF